MRKLFAGLLMMSMAACANQQSQLRPVAVPIANNDVIRFELKSWGRTTEAWSIAPTGVGTYGERTPKEGGPSAPYQFEWRDFDQGPEAYRAISRAIGSMPDPIPSHFDCENRMNDAPLAILRETRGAETREIEVYQGCYDRAYLAFGEDFDAITAKVRLWGLAQPIDRVDKFNAEGP